jgi:hypothetical protein
MKSLVKKFLIVFIFIIIIVLLIGLGILIKIKSERILSTENRNEVLINQNIPENFIRFIWKIKDPNYEACKLKIIDFIYVFYLNQNIKRNCEVSTLIGEVINIEFENQELNAQDVLYYNIVLSENYSAEELMEFYFNNIEFEKDIIGFSSASKYYFKKDIVDLNENEQIRLIAISELIHAEIKQEEYEKELNLKIEYIKSRLVK